VLDRFDDWRSGSEASDGANASIHAAPGSQGLGMRLDFDLGGTAGYALAARPIDLDLPPNYEIAFDLRADARVNDFQVKLVDASGENVWWFRRPNLAFPRDWQRITIKKRPDRLCLGSDEGPRSGARRTHRVRRGGRQRRRGLDLHQPPDAA
jgi:hypothetical protein